jgi:hypothetical protein
MSFIGWNLFNVRQVPVNVSKSPEGSRSFRIEKAEPSVSIFP